MIGHQSSKDIQVFAVENKQQLSLQQWKNALDKIPLFQQKEILRYRNWKDRQATLFGKLLLRKFLSEKTRTAHQLADIELDTYKKPFIAGNIEFNISHTDGLVVCAMSQGVKLGIDIEHIQPINLTEFSTVFTTKEYDMIEKSVQQKECFFKIWTRKEALMKADGRGFYLNPKGLSALPNQQLIAGQRWFLRKLSFPEEFVVHIATEIICPISVTFFKIKDL